LIQYETAKNYQGVTIMDKQSEILVALGEMKDEIDGVKNDAETFKQGLDDTSPDELTYDGDSAGLDEDQSLTPEDKDKAKEIKTPEEAKKVLEEATKDISDVIDHLDGIGGQAAGEEKEASVKRLSIKYAANLKKFADDVDTIVTDAKNALRHWAYLLKIRKPKASSIQNASLKEAAQTIEDVAKIRKLIAKLDHTATAVPPTRSDFSGDKWGPNGNPALVENRQWAAGASEFDKDRNREDARPNPAVDDRLQDKGNPHEEKPYVNARFVSVKDNKYGSYWDIFDSKTKKRIIATFANLPAGVAPVKNDIAFNQFSSKQYGDSMINNILTRGIGNFAKVTAAQEARPPLQSFAAEKSDLRKYYTDAYGSAEYAGELTSGADSTKMEEVYKPKDEHPASKSEETKDGPGKLSKKIDKLQKKAKKLQARLTTLSKVAWMEDPGEGKPWHEFPKTEEEKEKDKKETESRLQYKLDKIKKLQAKLAKKYPNFVPKKKKDKKDKEKKMSSMSAEEKALLKVRADKAIEVARRFAAVRAIPFTRTALIAKGHELLAMTDEQFKVAVATINQMPITNEAALKESHIPETENGVVGNKSEGVTNPKAKVKTEDINSNVKEDAAISKEASFVPQFQTQSGKTVPDITSNFKTVSNTLRKLGVDPSKLRLPSYRQY
jgi:hypothetical protein